MNTFDCEAIRDLLPSFARGELLSHEATLAQLHLDGCAPCRAEAEIVRVLQTTLTPVPADLEARVLTAVRKRRLLQGRPARLALAATLAAALIGGSFVYDRAGVTSDLDVEAVSWAAAQDPLLHGSSQLSELSVEELEMLLTELDQ